MLLSHVSALVVESHILEPLLIILWLTPSFFCLQVLFFTMVPQADKGLKADFQLLSSSHLSDHPGLRWQSSMPQFDGLEQ